MARSVAHEPRRRGGRAKMALDTKVQQARATSVSGNARPEPPGAAPAGRRLSLMSTHVQIKPTAPTHAELLLE
jgi:hypothetical protein